MEQLGGKNIGRGVLGAQPGKHWVLKQAPRVCCVDRHREHLEKAQ